MALAVLRRDSVDGGGIDGRHRGYRRLTGTARDSSSRRIYASEVQLRQSRAAETRREGSDVQAGSGSGDEGKGRCGRGGSGGLLTRVPPVGWGC
jgi:hypothetical protein